MHKGVVIISPSTKGMRMFINKCGYTVTSIREKENQMRIERRVSFAGLVAVVVVAMASLAHAADWPNFRGSNHNGVSAETGWLTAWPKDGPKQLWTVELGSALAPAAVCGGKVYAMGSANDKDEMIYCLDAGTGNEVWKHAFPNMAKDSWPGPRSTPAVDGKLVYVITLNGEVCCLDAASGRIVWSKDMKTEFGLAKPHHLFSCSPIVHGNLLLVNMGPAGVAFDKTTGNIVWNNTVPKSLSAYNSPVPFMQGGKSSVAFISDMALVTVDEATGKTNSYRKWEGAHGENSPDPLVIGNNLFVTTMSGCVLLSVDTPTATSLKKGGPGMACRFSTPVLIGDYVYGFNGSPDNPWESSEKRKKGLGLVCMDAKDCSIKWTQENIVDGGLMAADGKLIILDRMGVLILAEASPAGYKELARARVLPEPKNEPVRGLNFAYRKYSCFAMPVLCNGRIYVRNDTGTLACLDVRGK